MPDLLPLAQVVSVRNRYRRSIHLERDYRETAAGDYHLTECSYQVLRTLDGAFQQPSERAITLVGPYGAGKSAFCVYLAQLFAGQRDAKEEIAPRPEALNTLLGQMGQSERKLLPVLMVGSRQPIGPALVAGLKTALERGGHTRLLALLSREVGPLWDAPEWTPRQIADLFVLAAQLAQEEQSYGLLLVVDELGKFLEYAALNPTQSDVFVLQELAEAAMRTKEVPLLVLTVLHQSAESYAQKLGRTHRLEWAKIGERFRQVAFFPSDSERIDMVGKALHHHELRLPQTFEALASLCLESGLVSPGMQARFVAMALAAYPLHPLVALTLPTLFRKSGQSHRSMFNFLSGEEGHALGRFLRETSFAPDNPPLYLLDNLFDYAAEVLIGGWSASNLTRLWAEALESVERASELSSTAQRLLKCIGLLGILREPRVPASKTVLQLALTTADGATPPIETALEELVRRRLIVYSRVRDTYRLWEGGDVDVEGELARARSGLGAGTALHVATTLCPPPRLIARRHSYETGTVRTVTLRPCNPAQLPGLLDTIDTDLTVLLCLTANSEESEQAAQVAARCERPNLLTAIALESDLLRDAAADIAAAHQVEKEVGALLSDRAARRELMARRQEAETTFRAEWERLYGAQAEATVWWYRGDASRLVGSRAFSAFLSVMADTTYPQAPRLRNELVNRRALSSAAAAGRRNLIQAMLDKGSEPRLGFVAFPPELSMYECVLRATGIHRADSAGIWSFGPPAAEDPARLLPTWQAMEALIFIDPPAPLPLSQLFAALAVPPYGLTEGVLPVLLCAFLLANAQETTLYREGTFLPEPTIADYEVLIRRPEMFAVAGCRVTGARSAIVERLSKGLETPAQVVPIVRVLIRMVRGLPDHAWKTRRLPSHVLALREAFDKARSPERLLFHDLPEALNVPLLEPNLFDGETAEEAQIEKFFVALNGALKQWSQVTTNAVASARDILLEACGIEPGEAGWEQFRVRAAEMESRVINPNLLPLLRRAAQTGDSQTVLESVLALIANRPPRSWADMDTDRFPVAARSLGALFKQEQAVRAPEIAPHAPVDETDESRKLLQEWKQQSADVPPQVLRAALLAWLKDLDCI